ncbi:unnamed protein product [Brachionus calyciflorus]|uniref:Uncharacterized protein n=1 Tax=Brachionus calyciflorus TaxID=104777 RepID=A0A813MEK9_9BILA|nr:unnamed protein product [Brachionus calyciflorus]
MNNFYKILIFLVISFIHKCQFQEVDEKCKIGDNCILPTCNCDSAEIPIDLPKRYHLSDMPQLIILTIDDDKLDVKSYQIYRKLFENRFNPNNCSIKGTFFVSDSENKTSYCLTRNLFEKGHEIAISTVNYTCPHKRCSPFRDFIAWDYEEWSNQILNMRERLNKYAGIPKPAITGFRAPILEPASDMHYRIISSNKFLYDSSLILNTDDIIWPFTLNYKFNSYLSNNGPIHSYNGLWELPIPTYIDLDNENLKCLKLWEGHCKFDKSINGVAKFFRHHFLRAYYNNRAPIVFHLYGDWLKEYQIVNQTEIIPNVGYANKEKTKINIEKKEYRNLDGLIKFINDTLTHNKNVYFVTARQAIEWMKLLPRIQNENITNLLNEDLFENCNSGKMEYDGQCNVLKQYKPDYDTDESLILDDEDGDKLRDLLKIDHSKKSVLTDLQSEVLFVNSFVLYFVAGLGVLLVVVILDDRFF